jgi:hypothetical protein
MRSCPATAANLRDCTLMTKTATRKSGSWEAAMWKSVVFGGNDGLY